MHGQAPRQRRSNCMTCLGSLPVQRRSSEAGVAVQSTNRCPNDASAGLPFPGLRRLRTNLEIRKQFQRPHHGRVIPCLAAVRGERVSSSCAVAVLGSETPSARAPCNASSILLVKLDPEPWIEGPLDHPVAMDLKNFRGCKAAHQRLANLRRIGASFSCKQ